MSTKSKIRITVLLVDDDPDCRLMIRDALSDSAVDSDIIETGSGEEALKLLEENEASGLPRPGLVYLDIEMPGIGGLETLKRIKARKELRDIPVVMMTGVSDEAQMRKAAQLGANSYTLKPAHADQFLRMVGASTNYWLTVHQYPERHLPADACRR